MRTRVRLKESDVVALMRCVAAVGALLAMALTTADTDLWGHVLFGGDILDDGSLASRDPYSFTSDREWINHEWLAEVLMAIAYRTGGAFGLVVLKVVVFAAAIVLVSMTLRRVSWRPVDHDALLILAILAVLTRTHFMRPQLFSVLLFAALLWALTGADNGHRRLLIVVPPVMLAWANLHGGWTVGLGVLTIWIAVRLAQRRPGGGALVLVWVASVAATLVNPYGTGLWSFLRETVGLSRTGIADWQPLLDLPAVAIAPSAIMAVVAVLALAKARRAADPAYVLIVLALVVGALRISRIDAFFGIAVIMLLGPYLGRVRAAGSTEVTAAGRALARWPVALGAAGALAIALAAASVSTASCIRVDGEPEAESVAYLKRHAPESKVLTYFDWGEYAIWHLAPGLRISMDGRRETVYSDELFQQHLRLYEDKPGATALVGRLRPDLVWLPAELDVVKRLEREGWSPVFRGPTSVILDQRSPGAVQRAGAQPKRCFAHV